MRRRVSIRWRCLADHIIVLEELQLCAAIVEMASGEGNLSFEVAFPGWAREVECRVFFRRSVRCFAATDVEPEGFNEDVLLGNGRYVFVCGCEDNLLALMSHVHEVNRHSNFVVLGEMVPSNVIATGWSVAKNPGLQLLTHEHSCQ